MRLQAGVDHERAVAAPVLLMRDGVDAVHVGRGVRSRERDPEEVLERCGGEVGVVHDHDERKPAQRVVGADRRAKPPDVGSPRGRCG